MTAGRRLRRPAGFALVALGGAAILWATLAPGDPSILQGTPLTCLVCGATGMVDVWRNVVLFTPFGAGLALLGLRPGRAALLGLLLSLVVETLQLTVVVGRDPSLSDLLTNTTGAGLAALVVRRWRAWALPSPTWARRLAGLAAAAWLAALALTGAGLRWSSGTGPYQLNVTSPFPGSTRPFEGTVHAVAIDGEPVVAGYRARPVHPARAGDTLRLHARVTPSYAPGMLRPLIWLHERDWSESLVLGQRYDGLVVRLRTASADARFASPTFHLPGAVPAEPVPVALDATVTSNAVVLRSRRGDGRTAVLRIDRRLSLGWMLLQPTGTTVDRGALVSGLWLALLVLPLAYWGAMAGVTRHRAAAAVAALAALAVIVVAGPLALTAAYGLGPLGPADWAGIGAGLVAGAALAGLARRAATAATPPTAPAPRSPAPAPPPPA